MRVSSARTVAWLSLGLAWSQTHAARADETRACMAASTRGQGLRDEGHLLAARNELLACARDACPAVVKASCTDWLAQLDRLIPSVVVRVFATGAGDILDAHVTLDGSPIALDGRAVRLDPGSHHLIVAAPGWLPVKRTFVIAEREQAVLVDVQLPRRGNVAR